MGQGGAVRVLSEPLSLGARGSSSGEGASEGRIGVGNGESGVWPVFRASGRGPRGGLQVGILASRRALSRVVSEPGDQDRVFDPEPPRAQDPMGGQGPVAELTPTPNEECNVPRRVAVVQGGFGAMCGLQGGCPSCSSRRLPRDLQGRGDRRPGNPRGSGGSHRSNDNPHRRKPASIAVWPSGRAEPDASGHRSRELAVPCSPIPIAGRS